MPPRRAAKSAASANIALQLNSSDSENDEPPISHTTKTPKTPKSSKGKQQAAPKSVSVRKIPSRASLAKSNVVRSLESSVTPRPPSPSTPGVIHSKKRPRASSDSSDIEIIAGPSSPSLARSMGRPIPTYLATSSRAEGSSRKKSRHDVEPPEEICRKALLIRNMEDDDDEELPDVSVAFSRTSYMSSSQASFSISEADIDDGERWVVPEADPSLTIPGEPVLAYDRYYYWPAKILDYIPPTKRHQKEGKYLLVFLDGKEKALSRSKFYIAEEEGFGSCEVGGFVSTFEEVQADDEIEAGLPTRRGDRPPSPEALSSPPPPNTFMKLTIREKLAYIKPVLQAILNRNYPPALDLHNAFIAGGSSRQNLTKTSSLRGDLNPKDVQELQFCLMEWCLRDEIFAVRLEETEPSSETTLDKSDRTNESDVAADCIANDSSQDTTRCPSPSPSNVSSILSEPPSSQASTAPTMPPPDANANGLVRVESQPRQYGCEEYEALSRLEKIDYCLNVLLPEAIVQILVWHSGVRTSTALQSPEEEEALHQQGETKRKEHDWVWDIMRLKQQHDRWLLKRKKQTKETTTLLGGTKTRPNSRRKFP